MINSHPTLFLEINNKNLIFIVGKTDQNNILKIEYKLEVPLKGIENNRISNFDDIFKIIKENIFLVEQKFSYTFKELVLILEVSKSHLLESKKVYFLIISNGKLIVLRFL